MSSNSQLPSGGLVLLPRARLHRPSPDPDRPVLGLSQAHPVLSHRSQPVRQLRGPDLRSVDGEPVTDPVAEFAKRIQQPHMLALGSARYTEPLTAEELFRLWCLAHIPRLGEPVDVTTAFKAAKLPVARRLEALTGLAEAWLDRRLDSARLRAHISRRWAHLSALPCDSLLDGQIRSACRNLRWNRHIAHVLLHDDAPSRLHDSLVAFGTQPPQLLSREDVACFLEVPVATLEPLFGWSGILTESTRGQGFDADELFEAKRFLQQMLTERNVDQAIGVEGAVAELEYLHLLAAWLGLEDQPARYPASTLVGLFDQIFQSVASRGPPSAVTCLPDSLPEKVDAEAVVSAMALIQNGGLRAYGWAAPYRLVDLQGNPEEVGRALAESRV